MSMDVSLSVEALSLDNFEDFYRAEFPAVFRAAYLGTGDREDALDVTQEAFKRAYVRWRRLGSQTWAGGWVMTTALNLCRRTTRQRWRRPTDRTSAPVATSEASSERVDVVAALATLPRRQMTALVLFYVGDFAIPQIAHVMEISEGTVKAHLAQGRAALRKTLEVSDE